MRRLGDALSVCGEPGAVRPALTPTLCMLRHPPIAACTGATCPAAARSEPGRQHLSIGMRQARPFARRARAGPEVVGLHTDAGGSAPWCGLIDRWGPVHGELAPGADRAGKVAEGPRHRTIALAGETVRAASRRSLQDH